MTRDCSPCVVWPSWGVLTCFVFAAGFHMVGNASVSLTVAIPLLGMTKVMFALQPEKKWSRRLARTLPTVHSADRMGIHGV